MIEKMLLLATNHVSAETRNWLNARGHDAAVHYISGDCCNPLAVASFEYGWIVRAPVLSHPAVPIDLQTVLRYANQQGCEWVLFDRDAEAVDALPVFDW